MERTNIERFLAPAQMPGYFMRFYAVGLLLFMIPATRGLFFAVTGWSLVLVTAAAALYQRNWNTKTVVWFAFIALSSFLVEVFGVNTGCVFGTYRYGQSLGIRIYGTPLLIGLNWVLLTYICHDLAARYFRRRVAVAVAATLLMLAYDLVLEAVAPPMRMWHFSTPYPPLANFVAWAALSLVYQSGYEWLGITSDNYPARWLYAIQLVFFLVIFLYSTVCPAEPLLAPLRP